MSVKKISEAILGVGVDDTTIDLFESQYPVPTGVSYNSYVILEGAVVLLHLLADFGRHQIAGQDFVGKTLTVFAAQLGTFTAD